MPVTSGRGAQRLWETLDQRYARQRQVEYHAVIERVERNTEHQVTRVTARVQGLSGVPLQGVPTNATGLAAGQVVAAENLGSLSAPVWTLRGTAFGGSLAVPRVVEFNEDANGYSGGDLLLGNDGPLQANFFYDDSAGAFYGRIAKGEPTLGLLAAEGAAFFGKRTGKHVWIDNDTVTVNYGPATPALSIDSTNGIRQFSGGVQRTHIRQDGSGWFVDASKFWWDTAGNLTLAGNLRAETLRIGPLHGPTLYGGSVTDYDDQGQPLPTAQQGNHFGFWIEDNYGRRRIAMLTGTAAYPNQPALFIGAVDDVGYLRFEGDRLTVKGRIYGDEGEFAGFQIFNNRLESLNQKVALIAEADDAFGEGLLLTAGAAGLADAGTVRWNDPNPPPSRPNYTLGIKMHYFDVDAVVSGYAPGAWVMQSQITTPYGDTTTPTLHRWLSGQHGGLQGAMTLDHLGRLSVGTLLTGVVTTPTTAGRLTLGGLAWTKRLAGLSINTNLGVVARVSEHQGGFAGAPTTQLPINAAEVTITLPNERPVGRDIMSSIYLRRLRFVWQKTIAGAYFSYAKVLKVNALDGTVTEVLNLADVGQPDGTGRYTTYLVYDGSTPSDIEMDTYHNFYLVLKTAGVSSANHLLLHYVEIAYSDEQTTAL